MVNPPPAPAVFTDGSPKRQEPSLPRNIAMQMLADSATSYLPAGHHVRITQTGKMRSFIAHADSWLKLHPEVPLVLHTLPPSCLPPKPLVVSVRPRTTDLSIPEEPNPEIPTPKPQEASVSRPPSTITIPKLISVLELVKREYQASFSTSQLEDGMGRLWQYNTSGNLPQAVRNKGKGKVGDAGNGGSAGLSGMDDELVGLLKAGGNIKMTHCPYMVVVLSARPLTHLQATKNMTYQAVIPALPQTYTSRGKKRPYESQEDKARRLYVASQARKAAGMPRSGEGKTKGLCTTRTANGVKVRGNEGAADVEANESHGDQVEEDEDEDEELPEVEEDRAPSVDPAGVDTEKATDNVGRLVKKVRIA